MIKKITDDAISIQREFASQSILTFSETYMSLYLKYKTSAEHKHICNLLISATKQRGHKIAIAAPRGCGKSTIVTLIYILYSICYEKEKYIVLVSNTVKQVTQILGNVKYELRNNTKLQKAFPKACAVGAMRRLLHWQKDSIMTGNGITVEAISARQEPRGRRSGPNRPTLVIADDFESSESTFNFASRENMKETFENSILLMGDETTNYLIIGNLFHPHCLLGDYVKDDKKNPWIHECYSAIMEMPKADKLWDEWRQIYNFNKGFENSGGPEAALKFYNQNEAAMNEGAILFWPERYSLYDLMTFREENPITFQRELQNQPIDESRLVFDTDKIRQWNTKFNSTDDLLDSIGNALEIYGFCDPAMGKHAMKGDFSAVIVLAFDRVSNIAYVIEASIKRCRPEELIDDILAYCSLYPFVKFGVEANGFQEFVVDQLQKKADELKISIVFDKIDTRQEKETKIQALRFPINSGALQVCSAHRELLDEFKYFPAIKHDDALDSLAMAMALIKDAGRCDMKVQSEVLKKINKPSVGVSLPKDSYIYNGSMGRDLGGLYNFKQSR